MKTTIALTLATATLLIIPACATRSPAWLPAAVQTVACATVATTPTTAPYLSAASKVFVDLGAEATLPSAKAMNEALVAIPLGGLTEAQANAIWFGVVSVWNTLLESATTPEKIANLRATLTGIGRAVKSAVDGCGPSQVGLARVGATAMNPDDVQKLAEAIAAEILVKRNGP